MQARKKIRIGIVGGGRGFSFFDNIMKNDGEIVALCCLEEDVLANAKQRLGGDVATYTDINAFCEHDMDAVFLANYFHEHAEYAIKLLNRGVHVLSECVSNGTMAEGVALVRAAEKSDAIYMLAENYPYMLFNQEMKRVYSGGTLGKVLFAQGEYNHPFAPSDTGFIKAVIPHEKHWRLYDTGAYYITHSLAPLMYITGAFPKRVTAFPVFSPFSDEYAVPKKYGEAATIITCLNDDDSVFQVTGCARFGAHDNSYRVCCEKGQIENVRGTDKVMLRYNGWEIPEGKQEVNFYTPEWNDDDEEFIKAAGHGGGDFVEIRRFFDAIREGTKPDFDVYFATTTASVGILAHRSALEGGVPYDIPDFRREEDRKKYENDYLSPFWSGDLTKAPTLPQSEVPGFEPSAEQIRKYRELIGIKE